METKKWYESKTVWMNIIGFIIAFFTALQGFLQAGTFTIEAIVAFGVVIVNLILRIWFTDKPIE